SKYIVIFSIQEYPIKPVSFRGRYLKRIHNSNILLSVNEVVDIHLKTFNSSWDYHTNNDFKTENISLEKVQKVIDRINISEKSIIDDPLSFLFKKDLIREGLITNAAYLLFTTKESIFTTIELGRFQTDIIIKDSARTKNDIISQVEEVIDFVKKHINKEIIITSSPQNIEKWQYPLEAIREIVMNMIVHRDYRDSSDSILKIYNHKIEFFNPGRLPDNITEQDLLDNKYKSTPRNKLIADIFKEIGFIEKYGSGIQRIINYFSEAGLPRPLFQNQSNGFLVTVFTNVTENVIENVTENVTENRLNLIIEMMQSNPYITTSELAKRLEISRMTLH
ncbi:MAG TPA: ATP-binding protein, partial [Saprospiraceae bacterium]|nr:ATP-binding protein [Saprospiraceae bacterium]